MTELNKAVAVAVSTEPRVPAFIIEFVEKSKPYYGKKGGEDDSNYD